MSRELYDLCRRYKHYYKKVEDVKALDNKYHDLNLTSALSMSQWQLLNTEDEMLKQLFKEVRLICTSVDSENEVSEPCYFGFGRNIPARPRVVGTHSTLEVIDSNRFLKLLCEYMSDWRKGKGIR